MQGCLKGLSACRMCSVSCFAEQCWATVHPRVLQLPAKPKSLLKLASNTNRHPLLMYLNRSQCSGAAARGGAAPARGHNSALLTRHHSLRRASSSQATPVISQPQGLAHQLTVTGGALWAHVPMPLTRPCAVTAEACKPTGPAASRPVVVPQGTRDLDGPVHCASGRGAPISVTSE